MGIEFEEMVAEVSERAHAEEATGCARAGGTLRLMHSSDEEKVLTGEEALKLFEAGEEIEVPGAGAGDIRSVMRAMGLKVDRAFDQSSSAGDWTYELEDGRKVFQRNRYPFFGFGYSLES